MSRLREFVCALPLIVCLFGSLPKSASADPATGWTWIWAADPSPVPDNVYFRETFRLPAAPSSAILLITADDSFKVYVNGNPKMAGQGNDWTTVQEFNITKLLTKGQNLLAVQATNTGGPAGLLYKLQLTMPNGKNFTVVSSSRVKALRRPPPGWSDLKFADTSWPPAREIAPANAAPWGQLHGALVADASRLIRLWDIRAGGKPEENPYSRPRSIGDRMLLATSVTSGSDMRLLGKAGFTLFQSDSSHISTDEDAPNHWNWRVANAAGLSVNSLGYDWCYAPHNAFPPPWYRKSVPFTRIMCMEDHLPVQAFSPWDPTWPGFIDSNYDALAKQFNIASTDPHHSPARPDAAALSAIYVGIHGDYGEAGLLNGGRVSVPSQRAAWLKQFGDTHDHLGWWCDDPEAHKSFREAMLKKYGDLAGLNTAWKTLLKSPDEINYPSPLYPTAANKRAWLDFVAWYQSGVGHAVELNLASARKHFPNSLLMLPAGFADENPRGGNDNSLIPKLAAEYKAEVRSTHGGFHPFAENAATMLGRLGSACRFYNVPFWTESPGAITPDQEVGRIFEDVSQGAKGHFEWADNALANLDVFYRYGKFLKVEKPIVDVAMFYPAEAQRLRPDQGYNPLFQQACAYMRDIANFDIVDDRMVLDGCLPHYRVLALWEGTQADEATLDKIREWVNAGGTLLAYDFGKVTTFEGDSSWFNDMFGYSSSLAPAQIREAYSGLIPAQYRILVGEATASQYLSDDGWEKADAAVGNLPSSRWTNKPIASLRVPVKPDTDYSLIIRAMVPQEAMAMNHTVLVNGKAIGQLGSTGEVTYRFNVPESLLTAHPLTTVTFQSEMFTPAKPLPDHPDAKSLGVLIESVQLVEQGQMAQDNAPLLSGQILHELDPSKLRNAWTRLYGKGMTIYFPAQKRLLKGYMEVLRRAIYHLSEIDTSTGRRDALPIDDAPDGVYATLFTDKILYYNPKDTKVVKKVTIPAAAFAAWKGEVTIPDETSWTLTLEPHSIQAIYFSPEPQELLFECEKFTDLGNAKPETNPNCSPGTGPSCVSLAKGASISTRFAIDTPGKYTLFCRCVNGNHTQAMEITIDGQPIKQVDAQAGNTILVGTVSLAEGAHNLTLHNRTGNTVSADFVLFTNDPTIAGYEFASHFASVE